MSSGARRSVRIRDSAISFSTRNEAAEDIEIFLLLEYKGNGTHVRAKTDVDELLQAAVSRPVSEDFDSEVIVQKGFDPDAGRTANLRRHADIATLASCASE